MNIPTPHMSWEQLSLIPPSTIRIEVVVFVDGPTESSTIGWKVTDADTDDVIALGVDRPIGTSLALSRATEVLGHHVAQASATVSPF